jgi:hypothetical protein
LGALDAVATTRNQSQCRCIWRGRRLRRCPDAYAWHAVIVGASWSDSEACESKNVVASAPERKNREDISEDRIATRRSIPSKLETNGRYTSPSWSSWPWKRAGATRSCPRDRDASGSWGTCGAGVRSMSVMKMALPTVRPPIRLTRTAAVTHLLVSQVTQVGLHFQQGYQLMTRNPRFFFSIFESELNIESNESELSVRDESLPSLQKHRYHLQCQFKFGTHVSTAPEQYGGHATSSSPRSGHRSYYPPAHQH